MSVTRVFSFRLIGKLLFCIKISCSFGGNVKSICVKYSRFKKRERKKKKWYSECEDLTIARSDNRRPNLGFSISFKNVQKRKKHWLKDHVTGTWYSVRRQKYNLNFHIFPPPPPLLFSNFAAFSRKIRRERRARATTEGKTQKKKQRWELRTNLARLYAQFVTKISSQLLKTSKLSQFVVTSFTSSGECE